MFRVGENDGMIGVCELTRPFFSSPKFKHPSESTMGNLIIVLKITVYQSDPHDGYFLWLYNMISLCFLDGVFLAVLP